MVQALDETRRGLASLPRQTANLAGVLALKIERIDTIVTCPSRNFVTVKVITDEGVHGLGDATLNGRELAVKAYLDEHVIPCLIGRDPGSIEDIWQYLYRGAYWRRGPVTMTSIAAIDMALWDIKGKRSGALAHQPADAGRGQAALLLGADREQKVRFEEDQELDFSFGVREPVALPRQHLHAARRGRRRVPRHSVQHPQLRRARSAAGDRRAVQQAARPGAGHRPDRLGQVDHAGGDDRQDQHRAARAHHHDRRSDRVPARAQELPGQSARGRHRHARLQATR